MVAFCKEQTHRQVLKMVEERNLDARVLLDPRRHKILLARKRGLKGRTFLPPTWAGCRLLFKLLWFEFYTLKSYLVFVYFSIRGRKPHTSIKRETVEFNKSPARHSCFILAATGLHDLEVHLGTSMVGHGVH